MQFNLSPPNTKFLKDLRILKTYNISSYCNISFTLQMDPDLRKKMEKSANLDLEHKNWN